MERLTNAGQNHPAHNPKANENQKLWIVSPCSNRPTDAQNLCNALANLHRPPLLQPVMILVDNDSHPTLAQSLGPTPMPQPWTTHHLALPSNAGGSGGYNAGLAFALERAQPNDPIWLLDSDAQPAPEALLALLDALAQPGVTAAGSLLQDPDTGVFYELGGRVNPLTGEYGSAWTPNPSTPPSAQVEAQYLAACSLITTAHAVRRAGLLPDTFLNGDDVAWGFRLAQATGGRLVATPASLVRHPQWDRMRTLARYFAARNAMSALPSAGIGVFRKAMREAARAATLHATGLHALAELHLVGLRHAAQGRVMGPLPEGIDPGHPDRPGQTREEAASQVTGQGRVVSARGRRADWFAPRGSIAVDAQGGWSISTTRTTRLWRSAKAMPRGLGLAIRLHRTRGTLAHAPPAPLPAESRPKGTGLSIVVVAHNRKAALLRTLEHLHTHEPTASAQVIVVDNASNDGTATAVRERFPAVRCIEAGGNTGVAAFNTGVRAATGHAVLILDDDARPDPNALALALSLLNERPDLAAVALHPRHPDGGRSEWPFARLVTNATDAWPVMGCGNLVRTEAWQRAGGYCEPFFLYRNDTDLALSLNTLGGVWFDPAWVVWHDSPAATNKSPRWCQWATRNWLWMARRHARPTQRIWAFLGVLQAFRLANGRPSAMAAVLRGLAQGLFQPAPPAQAPSPQAWKSLFDLRLGRPPRAVARYVGPCPSNPTTPKTQSPDQTSPDQATSAPTSSRPSPTTSST